MALTVCTAKTMTLNEPATTRTSERPYDGNSLDGLGSGSPTARAPHCWQPSINFPSNLKPQHGQIVNLFIPLREDLEIDRALDAQTGPWFVY